MNPSPDVIVVGAGIIGLATALELSRRGARVSVLDPREPGQGATQASAGMLAPHIEGHAEPILWDLGRRSLEMYDAFVGRLRDETGLRIEYARCGSLHLATTEDAVAELRLVGERLGSAGVPSEVLGGSELHGLEPGVDDQAAAALFIPSHGLVSARDLVAALVAGIGARGMRLERLRADRIVPGQAGLTVQAGGERLHAAAVVLAAGTWTSQVAVEGETALPVRPIRGQLVRLAWPAPPIAHIVWGPACYLVPWSDGTVLVGATSEDAGFDERATVAGVRDLVEAACDVLPAAWQAGFAGASVGLRPATPDGLPVVGLSDRVAGLYHASGHYRNGVLLAPLTAAMLADLILGGREDQRLAALSARRFV